MMGPKTIKTKITVWFAVLLAVIVTAVILLLLAVSQLVLKEDVQGTLTELVAANTEELEYLNSPAENDTDEGDYFLQYKNGLLEIDDDFCDYRDGVSVALYGNGELLYGDNPIALSVEEYPFEAYELQTVEKNGEKYYVYDERPEGENLEGLWIRGIVSQKAGTSVLTRIVRLMIPVLPGLAGVAIIGGWLLAARALKPVDEICRQADSISEGEDLTKRIHTGDDSLELKQLEDAFNRMFERLNSSFESEKQFTSDASHELRTPVAVILAECEFALEEKDPAEYEDALQVIERQGRRMSSLIEEMLTFTRIERGTIQIHMEPSDLGRLTASVCAEQEKIRQKDVALFTQLQDNCMIEADKGLISRVITNLLSNAWKYGKKGGSIRVRVFHTGSTVVLEVEDDGIGIPESDLPKIWNRFYRADNARSDSMSAGLGLSLVKEIALIHKASVQAESRVGEGSTFRVIFPEMKQS